MTKRRPPRTDRPIDLRGKQYGTIVGDGRDVLLDIERAILLSDINVCAVDTYSNVMDQVARGASSDVRLSLQLSGRINKSNEHGTALFIFDADGAAAIVSEIIALASRIGPEFSQLLMDRMSALDENADMQAEQVTSPQGGQ